MTLRYNCWNFLSKKMEERKISGLMSVMFDASEMFWYFPKAVVSVADGGVEERFFSVLRGMKVPEFGVYRPVDVERVIWGKDMKGRPFLEVAVPGFGPIFLHLREGATTKDYMYEENWMVSGKSGSFRLDCEHELVGEVSKKFLKLLETAAKGRDCKELRKELRF